MTHLPRGWSWSTVSDVGSVELGRQRHPDWHEGPEMRPYLRVANVFEDRIDTSDVKEMDFSGCFERFKLYPGDVLLNEGQTPELLGRPAIYRGIPENIAFTNTLIRFRAGPRVTPEWALAVFRHHMHSGRFTRESRITTNIAHLSATRFKTVEFPVPPLDEQRRIVDILEDHLSRLDAAQASSAAAIRRSDIFETAALQGATHDLPDSVQMTLCDIADVRLGRQRSPKNHSGTRMRPYLRAANVGWDALRLDDVKWMQFSEVESKNYELRSGDILLTEASGSASEVGKSAVYRGEVVNACFQNTLLRVRCRAGVQSEFVQKYLLAEARLGRFVAESRGVGIHHLGRARLARWPISLPPVDRQDAAVARMGEAVEAVARMREATRLSSSRGRVLRRALLSVAFSGRLTGCSSDMERVEEMAGV